MLMMQAICGTPVKTSGPLMPVLLANWGMLDLGPAEIAEANPSQLEFPCSCYDCHASSGIALKSKGMATYTSGQAEHLSCESEAATF